MKYKKALIVLGTVLFFLAALTFYLNRIVFPQWIKRIAVERIEEATKRKVEIGSIHFNWVRGFIIDRIKLYERDSQTVFAQADQVSFGLLIFPGFKQTKITIPFIHVKSPAVRLVRLKDNTWNFSDLASSSTASAAPHAASTATVDAKSPNIEMAWGGITITDGQFQVEDDSKLEPWNEFFNHINLKLSLSYANIAYELSADIPGKDGFIAAKVDYEPLTKKTKAHLHLKNIDTASYLSLIDLPQITVKSGTIQDINLDINYNKEKISAKGDVAITHMDVANLNQSFKGNVTIHHLDAQYDNGNINAHGEISVDHMQATAPDLSTGGSVQVRVANVELTKENQFAFTGSLQAKDLFVDLTDRNFKAKEAKLENMQIHKSQEGLNSSGNITTQGLWVHWPNQELKGDVNLKNVSLHMKDANNISLEANVQANNFFTQLGNKTLSAQQANIEDATVTIKDQKDISLYTRLSLDEMSLKWDNVFISGALKTDKLSLSLNDDFIQTSTVLNFSKAKFVLSPQKTIEADPQVELNLQLPLKTPEKISYKGSITFSSGTLYGFSPLENLNNVNIDADFQNDQITINALEFNMMNTDLRLNGLVTNFRNPKMNITAEADELDLAKIKDLAPQWLEPLGLDVEGIATVKVKFNGFAADPLAANILAVASFKNASAYSRQLHQKITHMTGIVEATPNSLKWRDLTAVYENKKYSFIGSLQDFKRPRINATLQGPQFEVNADLVKNADTVTVNFLKGKYFNTSFDSHGIIDLPVHRPPVFDFHLSTSFLLEELVKDLPLAQQKSLQPLNPTGVIHATADFKGTSSDWRNDSAHVEINCPLVTLMGYKLKDIKVNGDEDAGKIKNMIFDAKLYDGTVHAVGSLDLLSKAMPYELALNVDNADMHEWKMDSPFKMQEINGKFYFTSMAHGTMTDFKNNLQATGSLAIRNGFLAEFNIFKGLLSVLNDALRLGQVEITDVESNFTIANQKINTDNLRLKGPTIVLLGKGWIDFDQTCDLTMTVDLSSGIVPAIAHDVLNTLSIRIYDKIADPKFKKKISVPQVINSLIKNLLE